MNVDSDHVREIEEAVSAEGEPRLIVPSMEVIPSDPRIPSAWIQLLKEVDVIEHVTGNLWKDAIEYLPKVVSALERKLQGVGILLTNTTSPSLVYLFVKRGELFARRGFLPIEDLPEGIRQLPIDLLPVYRIHDGWVDFFSADTGPLRTKDWNVVGESIRGAGDGFLEVFTTGATALGFDLSEDPAEPKIIWSDGDVESIDNFWGRLDEWIAGELHEMDDRSTQ